MDDTPEIEAETSLRPDDIKNVIWIEDERRKRLAAQLEREWLKQEGF